MISKLYFTLFTFIFSLLAGVQKVLGEGLIRSESSPGGITKQDDFKLPNPLGTIETISDLITKILDIVVQIGLPVIALAIVYSGFLFLKARGNDAELTKAKETLWWTVIGAAVILGAFVIQITIEGTITELGKN